MEELETVVAEELAQARAMSWRELSKVTPWGDSFRGFAPSGREVEISRSYLWEHAPGGDILCEVEVRSLADDGPTAAGSALISRP